MWRTIGYGVRIIVNIDNNLVTDIFDNAAKIKRCATSVTTEYENNFLCKNFYDRESVE